MLIDKDLILEAKEKFGTDAMNIIANDLKLEEFSEKDGKSLCPFHREDTPSFIWNRKDNSFHCFACGVNYGIIDHYMQFNNLTFLESIQKLFSFVGIKYQFGEKGVKTKKDYRYPKYDCCGSREKVDEYLGKRKISKETLDYCDVCQDESGNIVFNFFDTNDVLTLVKYRPSKKIEHETKSWCQKDADTRPLLFNMNRIDTTKPLLITEGEIDTLSIIEAGYKNAVSVPLGANNFGWIEENFEWLEQFDKIIIWSDNDKSGLSMRREACARLGTWRTLYVDLPNEIKLDNGEIKHPKDANEILFYLGSKGVLDFIDNAQELPITGIKDLSSIEDFDLEQAEGLYPRLKSIKDIVYKFLFGSVVLVTGLRGSGKSTAINQFFVCEPLEQGHDIFMFSGELSGAVLKSWIELTMAGPEKIKMKDDFVHIIDSQARKEMRDWYKGRIWIYNENSNKIDDILDKAIASTRKYGTKVWVIDNLMTLDIGASDKDINQKQKDLIVKLNKLALLYNVLIVLVAHPRKLMAGMELVTDDISGSGDLGNLAQYILSVRRFNQKEKAGEKDGKGNYKTGKEPIAEDAELNLMKNRYTGKIDKTKVFFNYASYRFYNTTSELNFRYKWNESKEPESMIDTRPSGPF